MKLVLNIEGQDFTFTKPVQYKFTDPVKGELYQPLTVVPAITGRFEPALVLLSNNEPKSFDVVTRKESAYVNGIKTDVVNTGNANVKLFEWHVYISCQ